MNVSPVSFGSLMVFKLNDGKPDKILEQFMKVSFAKNPDLAQYSLDATKEAVGVEDGTVHNSAMNYARNLDEAYKAYLQLNPKKVVLTKARFSTNRNKVDTKYFLTAATAEDEEKIHQTLSKSKDFFVAKFYSRK